jgi:hypothetical protein
MEAHNSVAGVSVATPQVISLPYAWYVSGDLIFELYEGGKPPQTYSIQWEHLKPITKLSAPPDEGK